MELSGTDNHPDTVVKEIPEDVMQNLLFKPLSEKMRILNRHKKEKKPIEKRVRKLKPRPNNRDALVKKQKKAR